MSAVLFLEFHTLSCESDPEQSEDLYPDPDTADIRREPGASAAEAGERGHWAWSTLIVFQSVCLWLGATLIV
ncbi:hypothetical protein JOB18_037564 [Solea senegalensis]|uniref:Uncharacterized protein n=1 Tax=Solea senegalensis TaxID=28829 RepID=A0AAV6R4R5_SOLSE|nr:hypothetical protein JOB18_037564 [Solea senegalensis]